MPSSTSQRDIDSDEETTPLLAVQPKSQTRDWRPTYSPAVLLIPVALLCRLAIMLPVTTTYYVVQQFICRLHYLLNDPDSLPSDGSLPASMCAIPIVEKNFATALIVVGLMEGLGGMIGYACAGHLAAKFGRKPIMLVALGLGFFGDVFIVGSTLVNAALEPYFLLMWITCQSFTIPSVLVFIINMFVVDLVDAEGRTAALSSLSGWGNLGGAISLTVGGLITTHTSRAVPVYCVAGVLWATAWLYVALFLSESFPKHKREELRLRVAREAQEEESRRTDSESMKVWRRVLGDVFVLLAPLKQLKPTWNGHTGKRNWRLVFCGIHIFFAELGANYSGAALVIYTTTRFNYTPADTGMLLTTAQLSSVVVLTVVIPLVVRVLRPLYKREMSASAVAIEAQDDETVTEATDHLDVHLAFASWVIEAFGYILVTFMTTYSTVLAAVVFVGFSAGRSPVFRSLVVASVDPLKQGETLAAIEMVASVGTFLSPLVMGAVLTQSISTFPRLVFYVQAAIVIPAAAVLFFVRDVDRYQKPHSD